jgi:hypothetical protein
MTKDEILSMAKEAGIDLWWESGGNWRSVLDGHLERFAALVAEKATEQANAELVKANSQAEHFEREWYLRGDELDATNRQVEILSDALAESRREVAVKDEALKLALEALATEEYRLRQIGQSQVYSGIGFAINAIKQALAAPVQEPVAWRLNGTSSLGHGKVFGDWKSGNPPKDVADLASADKNWSLELAYTTPPAAQRQWVGLTDEEIKLQWSVFWEAECHPWAIDFARAIESKLRKKNT